MAAASPRSLAAAACLLALLFAGFLQAADARRLLDTAAMSPGLAPAPSPGAAGRAGRLLFEAPAPSPGAAGRAGRLLFEAPAPSPGADRAGRLLSEGGGRALLGGGLRLAGRLLLGLGL
ncbi:unnamed protein product [Urochloa decumbens]|uniref:Uncharacterized protein n=1 Tax=Urochloa decumbens TaxID=240449 RepID=A0ABC8YI30_9POAL